MLKSSLSMNANFNSAVLAEQVGVIFIASPSASGMKKKGLGDLAFSVGSL